MTFRITRPCRLQIGDTAENNSALRQMRPVMNYQVLITPNLECEAASPWR
jgi:hypothetical protein